MSGQSLSYAPNTEGLSYVSVEWDKCQTTFDNAFDNDLVFSPKTTRLNRGNFAVPGKGERPDYCHMPYIAGIKSDGSGAKEIYVSCKLARCPDCYRLWVDNEVYQYAVLLEAYSLVSGSRPFRAVGSIPADMEITLQDLRNKRRSMKDRLKRQGITAMFSLDHPFRIKNSVKGAIKDILAIRRVDNSEVASGALWEFLLNEDNLDAINEQLGTEFVNWRHCVDLSPHTHFLLFDDCGGYQKITGDKDIFIKKLTEPNVLLESVKDVVKHMKYLFTHCEILVNAGKCRSKPAGVSGGLYDFNPSEYLTEDELQRIKDNVLEVLNENRTKPLIELQDGNLGYSGEPTEDTLEDDGYLPMSEFVPYSSIEAEAIDAWIAHIPNKDNMRYCEYLINRYRAIISDDNIPAKMRRLFTRDLVDPPESFVIERCTNIAEAMGV